MDLEAAVKRYLEVVRDFRLPMPLTQFGLPQQEVETMVEAWEEDYHLHRHYELIPASVPGDPATETAYRVHGVLYTAIVFRDSIREALGHHAT